MASCSIFVRKRNLCHIWSHWSHRAHLVIFVTSCHIWSCLVPLVSSGHIGHIGHTWSHLIRNRARKAEALAKIPLSPKKEMWEENDLIFSAVNQKLGASHAGSQMGLSSDIYHKKYSILVWQFSTQQHAAATESNNVGSDAIERLHFVASLPLASTGQREGGEKTQPFNRFQSRLGTHICYTLYW